MILSHFEQQIDERVMERGLDYFKKGKVSKLEKAGGNRYKAKVAGTETYSVIIEVSQSDEIVDSYCDCPFDLGDFCKHQAAVLFTLKEQKAGGKPVQSSEEKLKAGLLNKNQDQLIDIILNIADHYPDIEKQLLYKYVSDEDEINSSKKLIRQYINSAKRKGFIDWRSADYALQGAELTLEKAKEKIESGKPERSIELSIAVLSIVVKMLDFTDDSNGSISPVMNGGINTIDEAVIAGADQLTEKEQKKLFQMIIKEALNARYDGWSDWRYDLLKICIKFCKINDLREKLESELNKLIHKVYEDSWTARYEENAAKLLLLEIIEKFDDPEKAEKFIYENIRYFDFREKAITLELQRGNYEKVIDLCLEEEESDNKRPGYVLKCMEYRYRAYELMGDIEKQKQLAHELIFKNEYEYYNKLKGLYTIGEWENVLTAIVEKFEQRAYYPSTYLSIIKAENMTGKILEYCKREPYHLADLYPDIIASHFDEVNELFIDYINRNAAEANERRKYKGVCKLIKTYNKACGANQTQQIIEELKQKYPRRPAFLDELQKLKIK